MGITIDSGFRPDPARREDILKKDLGFGRYFADRMFTVWYDAGKGWHDAKIGPYGAFEVDPAAAVLHYGQACFEGQKAYYRQDGEVGMFRPTKNARRFARSCERLVMPAVPEDLYMEALETLIDVERAWVPRGEMQSLYVRPFMFATEPLQGVRAASQYVFTIILSPVGAYYAEGFNPVKIWVTEKYVRAVPGGTGEAKAAGNYAASLAAAAEANQAGCAQVMWLDAVEHRYIEEIGAMNVMFVIDGKVVTSPLTGSILPGITRQSIMQLVQEWGIPIEERRVAIDELIDAVRSDRCKEVFGCGTATVVSAIRSLRYRGEEIPVSEKPGEISQRLFDTITGIQYGRGPDPHEWMHIIPRRAT